MASSLARCANPEGWGPVSPIRTFDLTPCFEEGIVLSTVLVLFLVAAAPRCWVLSSDAVRTRSRKSVWVLRIKLVRSHHQTFECGSDGYQILLSLACAASCTNFILVLATRRPVAVIQSYVLEALALLVTPILTLLSHYRTRSSSNLLLLFWPLYAFGLVAWGRTVLSLAYNAFVPVLALRCAVAVLGLLAFGLECLGPEFTPEDRPASPEKGQVESPLLTANLFSIWTFSWMSGLMKKGASTFITEDDLPSLVPEDESASLGRRLQKALKKQYVLYSQIPVTQSHSLDSKSLSVSLFAAYGGSYAFAALLKITQDCLSFLQPQLLRWLLAYISEYQTARSHGTATPSPFEGFAIAVIMFAASVAQTIILHQVCLNRPSANITPHMC